MAEARRHPAGIGSAELRMLLLLGPRPTASSASPSSSSSPWSRSLSSSSFFSILFMAYLVVGFCLLPTHPHAAALQLAAAAWSDDESSSATQGYASVLARIALAFCGVIFSLLFCLYLFAVIDPPVLLDPDVPLRRLGAPRDLDPAVIGTFLTVVYSAVKGHKIGEASLECAVCMNDFGDDDMLRLIPKCDHAFHPNCIRKWLACHTTCPVCRADLASRPAGSSASQLAKAGTVPPRIEVKVESATPDGGAAERSRQEGRPERIQPPDPWDKNESGSFSNPNRTGGSGRIRRFPRSLVRPGEDMERFTLRLPAEVRKQLMDRPGLVLPLEGCSRRGYRCGGEGSSLGRYSRRPDRLDWAARGGISIVPCLEWRPTVAEGPLRVRFNRLDRLFSA